MKKSSVSGIINQLELGVMCGRGPSLNIAKLPWNFTSLDVLRRTRRSHIMHGGTCPCQQKDGSIETQTPPNICVKAPKNT